MRRKTRFVHNGISAELPQVHEIVRLTHSDRSKSLADCVDYRSQPSGGMSLTWLRDSAFALLSGQMTLAALERAVIQNVPEDAQTSILEGVRLLHPISKSRNWRGAPIPPAEIEIGRGLKVPLEVVGLFDEAGRRWVVVLQPRLRYHPTPWQMEIWLSLLEQAFCADPLRPATPMIVDISFDKEKAGRALHVLTPENLRLLPKSETDERLDKFVSAYLESVELVPQRPKKKEKPKRPDENQSELPL